MTFSLLGLIAFQWYWVSNYFESNKLELDWEINRVLARTADRYLNDSMEGNLNDFSWMPDSLRSSITSPLNSFNLYHNKQNVILDSILDTSGHMGNSMAENYMNKVSGLINDLLMNLNQPKVINFDKLLFILDEELEMVGLKSNYNIAISNINNKVIYFKEPETLTATVMSGYKSPIILSSISNPYFIHLNLYKKDKLLLQKNNVFVWESRDIESLLFVKDEYKSIEIGSLVQSVTQTDSTTKGISAICKEPPIKDIKSQGYELGNIVLIMDEIQDTRNLGSCLRSASFFGVNSVVIPKNKWLLIRSKWEDRDSSKTKDFQKIRSRRSSGSGILKGKDKKAQKLYKEALKFLYKSNKENPFNPDTLNYLGFANRKINNVKDAEVYYLMGLEIDPKHVGINEYLGELYVLTNRHNLAIERLEVLKGCNCEEYQELKDIIAGKKVSKY